MSLLKSQLQKLAMLWVALLLALPIDVSAQSSGDSQSLQQQIYACFDRADYTRAVELIEQHLQRVPNDYTMLYNLACAHCQLGDHDAAARSLLRAFKAGFRDIDHLRSDPDLAPLREHPTYKTILEKADSVSAHTPERRIRGADSAFEQWREIYGEEHYRYETDEKHRLKFATALDDVAHDEMREMLERQADQMIQSLFGDPPEYDVLIAVPTPEDADKFFNGNDQAGGMYEHRKRRLVARDIGGTLRHEFFHAYHFGHMERIRQVHPLWIQEGLASLYEDYEFSQDGSIRFVPNDRQIAIKNRAKAGRLTKWTDMMAMSSLNFMADAQRNYPQARSMFEFVADQGKLEEWYREFVSGFSEDETGSKAFEKVFGKPLNEIERDWRRWLHEQPMIDLSIRGGDAALGIRTKENGSNDGVLITDVLSNSAAARAGLRERDVIVSVDGRATRSLVDLRKVIAAKEVGDQVEVRVRRDGEYFTARVVLRPLAGSL